MYRIVLATLLLIGVLSPSGAQAQRFPCGAADDPIVSTICASPPMLARETGLRQDFAAALVLVDEARRKAMKVEQSEWETGRRKACQNPPSGGVAACIDALTEPRAHQLAALLPQVLDDKGGHLTILDKRLEVWIVDHPWPREGTWVQLRHDTRVIVEGRQGFQVLARAGNGTTEAVVVRGPAYADFSGHQLFAIVVTRGGGIEVWPLMGSARSDSLGIHSDASGFTLTGSWSGDDGRTEVRWTAEGGWQTSKPATMTEKLDPAIEVTEAHAPEPAIQAYCDEPRSPGLSATCRRSDVAEVEASLDKALRDCIATLGRDDRAITIDRHNRAVERNRRVYGHVPVQDQWSIVQADGHQAESYRDCAGGEVATWGGKIKRDPQEIVVGTKKLVEAWVPSKNGGEFQVVLRLGTSVVIEAEPGRVEVDDEIQVGNTSAVIVDTPSAGTDMCHIRYLIADFPGRPLRVWTVPDRWSCLSSGIGGFEIDHTVEGYRFEVTPSPFADGAVYRWTPVAGITFEKTLVYPPEPGSLAARYREVIARVEGPSVGMLRDYLSLSRTVLTPDSRYTVLGECDQPFRACLYRGTSPIRALFENGGRALYVALYDPFLQGAACGATFPFRPLPNIPTERTLLDIPIAYHPAREQWPAAALEVLRTTFCPPSP